MNNSQSITCGSSIEDPHKSYKGFKFIFAINLISKPGENIWSVPNRRFMLNSPQSQKLMGQYITSNWYSKAYNKGQSLRFAILMVENDCAIAKVEKDLNSFGAGEVLELGELNGPAISSSQIDKFIPWFDLLCGLALLVGFCTPIAAIATAGFLLTVCLTQFPGAVGAQPVYYQSIEMFALLVVAFAGGGKYLSLDSIINHYCKRCCGKTEQSA